MSRANAGTKGVPRADREAQIVRAAAEVFGADGFAGTSVAAVAARAGISKPLIYQYFGSKERLFSACVHEAGQVLGDEIERIAGLGAVGLERALNTLDGMFRLLEPQPWVWRILYDPSAPREGQIAREIASYTDRMSRLAEEGVTEMMRAAGDVDPLDHAALTAAWLRIVDALVTWWLQHPDVTPEEMSARCVRIFQAVVGAEMPVGVSQ